MQRLVSLFGRLFQCVQFFFCRLNLRLQRLVFLGKEVCIARIQLEELIDILQLAFRIFDFGIDVLEGGFEFGGVATDLDCDALYSSASQFGLLFS